MLELYVTTLITNDKFSRHNTDNFPQPIRMQLSKKPKVFVKILLPFLNLHEI